MIKNKSCYLVYDYYLQLPVAVFDNLQDLSDYMQRGKASLLSQISRLKNDKIKFTCDSNSHKYQIFKIDLGENKDANDKYI